MAMTTHETLEAKVDQLFAEWDKPDSPGAALAVTRDGEVIYKRHTGRRIWNMTFRLQRQPSSILLQCPSNLRRLLLLL